MPLDEARLAAFEYKKSGKHLPEIEKEKAFPTEVKQTGKSIRALPDGFTGLYVGQIKTLFRKENGDLSYFRQQPDKKHKDGCFF